MQIINKGLMCSRAGHWPSGPTTSYLGAEWILTSFQPGKLQDLEAVSARNPSPSFREISPVGRGRNRYVVNYLFEIFEAAILGFDPQKEDQENLHDEKTDHETEHAAYAVGLEQCHDEERGDNRRPAPERVRYTGGPHTHFGGEQLRNVDGEQQRDQDIDRNHQQETHDD